MAEENDVTANKLAEENQGTTEDPKEPQRVTTKNLKKAEAGKRLAAHNRRKREEKKREEAQKGKGVNQYYCTGIVIAIGAIGGLGYYIYRTKREEIQPQTQPNNPPNQPSPCPKSNKFEMD